MRFRVGTPLGQHIRRTGEDIATGEVVLAAGIPLGPGEIGLLAALGRTLVQVHRRPHIAIVSTGDELVPADVVPGPGQIVNSNAHALLAQVSEAGAVGRVLPIAVDNRDAITACFAEAARADILISSGGVSVGEFDYVREALLAIGAEEQFSKVAMRPGKPLQFRSWRQKVTRARSGAGCSAWTARESGVVHGQLRAVCPSGAAPAPRVCRCRAGTTAVSRTPCRVCPA